MYCTNCKEYRNSRYNTCNGACRSGNCEHVCSHCGEHTLIEYSVQKVGDQLGLNKSSPVLLEFQQKVAQVNAGGWRDEFTVKIEEASIEGYRGPTRFITYNKNRKFQITGLTFLDNY